MRRLGSKLGLSCGSHLFLQGTQKCSGFYTQHLNLSNAEATFVQMKRAQRLFYKKQPKPCHVGTHWIALADNSQMSTHESQCLSNFFSGSFASFCIGQIRHQQHKGKDAIGLPGKNLTLPMLRLLLPKAQGHKVFWKPSKPYHVGIHWITLVEYSQMSTRMPGFR